MFFFIIIITFAPQLRFSFCHRATITMAFQWKEHREIWKGEGIYHLTFVVSGRKPLLGELLPIEQSRAYSRSYSDGVERLHPAAAFPKLTSRLAVTELSAFGYKVLVHLQELPARYQAPASDAAAEPAILICGKQFMPDHLHVVIWVKNDVGKSIRQIAQGFRIGIKKLAIEMGIWKEEDGHVMEVPFIRTLSHKGQLRQMIDYVHGNPDNVWRRKQNPDLYVIRRNRHHAGLLFDTMGKARLLDYPDRQVIALSRSLSEAQITEEVKKALSRAERGVVTYTAAMNAAEKAVATAIREAGYPMVVMMLSGFPPEGSEEARFFHPSGIYHRACGEGRLYLMAPQAENFESTVLIARTEAELQRKAEEKHLPYAPLPHDSTRWRMIAGNTMLQIIAEDNNK